MKRLGKDSYQRPKFTKTDKLTNEEINDLLDDYEEMDIYKIPLGSHVRYIMTQHGRKKFRYGGNLINNRGLPDYVVIANGKDSWCAQTKNTQFFRRLTLKEIKKEYNEHIDELEQKIMKLKQKNHNLLEYIKKLKKELN